jgi:hypothetical protein
LFNQSDFMKINFTQRQNFIAIVFYIAIMLTASSASSNYNRSEIRINDTPYYSKEMHLASNPMHDQGRKYIDVAVPSLKTEHFTTRLDSISKKTDLQRKEIYTYDENFRISQRHDFVFAWNIEWQNWWQYFYEYNDLGYITLAWEQRWDNSAKKWVPYRKYEYTYNENNSIVLYVSYEWNIEKEEWRYIGKDEFTYTPFYFIQEVLISDWQQPFGEEGRWVPWYKNEYFYNNSFALMELLESTWKAYSEEWRVNSRTVYERISLGRVSVETIFSPDGDEWIGHRKYEYTYPSGNNFNILTKKGSQFNSWETLEWENMDSLAFSYHPVSGFIESEEYYSWRTQDSIWLFSQKDDYLYDENFNLINYQRKRWSQIQNNWEPYIEEQASFNSSNLSAEYIVKPFWYEWTNMIDEYKRRLWDFDKWRETNHTFFYYSPLDATSVSENLKEELKVYPNPAREYVFVDLSRFKTDAEFELYDLTGKRIITRTVSGSSQISLDGLRKGLYLYIITMPGQHRISGKLAVTE